MPLFRSPARLLAAAAVLAAVALALPAASSAAVPCANANVLPSSSTASQARAATLCLINDERSSRGLAPLRFSRHLTTAAQRYSRLMVRERFFSHVSRNGSTLTGRVRRQTSYLRGARSWALGENIAWGSGDLGTPAHTIAAWMKSSAHRANILKPRFHHLGIGIASGAPRSTNGMASATYTIDFGRRS